MIFRRTDMRLRAGIGKWFHEREVWLGDLQIGFVLECEFQKGVCSSQTEFL